MDQAVELIKNKQFHCIVCEEPDAEHTGVFMPDEKTSEKMNVPENKLRIVPYGLCNRCMETVPNFQSVAEENILNSYSGAPHVDLGEEPPVPR